MFLRGIKNSQFLMSAVLLVSLLFGNVKSAGPKDGNDSNSRKTKRFIAKNRFDDSEISDITVETGTGIILRLERKAYNPSSNRSAELDFLNLMNATDQKTVLVKDSSNKGFAEAFGPAVPRRNRRSNQIVPGTNVKVGSDGSSPSGNGNNGDSCQADSSSNLYSRRRGTLFGSNPNSAWEDYRTYGPKTKDQQAKIKKEKALEESIKEEKVLNKERKKRGLSKATLAIKDGERFFTEHNKVRDKFQHARDLGAPIPRALTKGRLERLANPNLYKERLTTFRDKKILPDAVVSMSAKKIRSHILDPNTRIIEGTYGANRESRTGQAKVEGFHLYNDRTGLNVFFNKADRTYKTGFKLNRNQIVDLKQNKNVT